MPAKKRPAPKGLTVFEAVNVSRREIFVGCTDLPMHALTAGFGRPFPPELGGWRPHDTVSYRSLEFGLSAGEAAAFILAHSPRREGWRTIKAPPDAG